MVDSRTPCHAINQSYRPARDSMHRAGVRMVTQSPKKHSNFNAVWILSNTDEVQRRTGTGNSTKQN